MIHEALVESPEQKQHNKLLENFVKSNSEETKTEEEPLLLLPNLSEHQAAVIDLLEEGYNVKVFAHPGCGKSTLITQMVLSFPRKKLLIVSFNKALVQTTKDMILEKAVNRDFSQFGVEVRTFHGLMSSVTKQVIHNETLFWDALVYMNFNVLGHQWSFNNFDMLIVDESQDLRKIYLIFLFKILLEMHPNRNKVQVVLLGDVDQLVYNFFLLNSADRRFFTKADHFFGLVLPDRPWLDATLPVSYRLTPPMVQFSNALLPNKHIVSGNIKNHQSSITDWVELYIADVYLDAPTIVYNIVKRIVGLDLSSSEDVLILFPSVNSSSPAVRVVDKLIAEGYPVHVVRSGVLAQGNPKKNHSNETNATNLISKDITKGKIVVQTVISAKGLERKYVIFVNVTELLSPEFVTNIKFVGMTRASKQLFIIQNYYYTSQTQIDNLIAKYPDLRQQDLRIIVTRPIPKELRKRKSREEQSKSGASSFFSTNGLDTSSLFAFLDVEHMQDLAKHIATEVVYPSFLLTESKHSEQEVKDDNTEEDNLFLFRNYIDEMTLSFDNGKTYTNVNNICNTALQLSLEFGCTRGKKHLVKIKMIQNIIQAKQDAVYVLMKERIYNAFDILFSSENKLCPLDGKVATEEEDNEKMIKGLCQRMGAFANLAIVCDAFQGYREYLRVIYNYDFILQSQNIEIRVRALWTGLCHLCAQHSQEKEDLEWYKEETGRFLYKQEYLQLKVHPCIVNKERTFIVMFSNNIVTNEDDRFAAAVTALVLHNPSISSDLPNVYIINLFDTSIEQVNFLSDYVQDYILPSKEDEETNNLENDMAEDKKRKTPSSFSHENGDQNMDEQKTKPAVPLPDKRRKLCPFLESAITFKVSRQEIEENENNKSNLEDNSVDNPQDLEFINVFKEEIQDLIDTAETNKKQQAIIPNDFSSFQDENSNFTEETEKGEEEEEEEEEENDKHDCAYNEF